MKLNVASWNILADCYIRGQLNPNGLVNDELLWANRKNLISSCLNPCIADIFCLQEVDHFSDFYQNHFETIGFQTVYLQRPRKKDGCLIAFNRDKFEIVEYKEIYLDDIAESHSSTQKKKFIKQNVALFVKLLCKETKKEFVTSTCHIHWNPNLPEVKRSQVQYILYQLIQFSYIKDQLLPTILTGDFNIFPTDEIYQVVTDGFTLESMQQAFQEHQYPSEYLSGSGTKFMCDPTLSKLCRWMRVLGVDVAMDTWDASSSGKFKSPEMKYSINNFFDRARKERRIILTTSKTLRERSSCPQNYYVDPGQLETGIANIFAEFNLELKKENFLTVCGKCGGEIERVYFDDPRMADKTYPRDRHVFMCVNCSQPYWWSEREDSSPAKAMKKADSLYKLIKNRMGGSGDVETIDEDVEGELNKDVEGNFKEAMEALVIEETEDNKKDKNSKECSESSFLSERFDVRNKSILVKEEECEAESTVVLENNNMKNVENTEKNGTMESTENKLIKLQSIFYRTSATELNKNEAADPSVFEPKLTNWNGEFQATLDYIFVSSGNWTIDSATAIPFVPSKNVHCQNAKTVFGEFPVKGGGEDYAEENRVFKILNHPVEGSLPSLMWPSDHLMLLTTLSLS